LIEAARRIQSSLPPPQPFDDPRGHGCRAIGEKSFHSIAPCWSEKDQRLYWADRLAPAVYGLDDLGEPRLIAKTPQPISAIGIAPEGGVDVVCEESWLRVEPLSEAVRAVGAAPRGLSTIRVGEDGARWGAVVGDGKSEIGLLDPEGGLQVRWSVSAEISDLAVTGGGLVYGADGARGLVYEFESRRSAPRVLARIARASGEPRALALDADGRLWVALWDGWSVARIDENGEIDRILALPVPRPTGLAFGGAGLNALYVTSARVGLSRDVLENAPSSGCLHRFASWR
jgi:sugar lactone lactonase YvrE